MFTGTSGWVDHFDWQARVALGFCRCGWPVSLRDLFPHDCVEAWAGLVAEHEPSVVIISVRVDEERSAEIDCTELIITWNRERDGLDLQQCHDTSEWFDL